MTYYHHQANMYRLTMPEFLWMSLVTGELYVSYFPPSVKFKDAVCIGEM